MYEELLERLENIKLAINRIFVRNENINTEDDYYCSALGMEKLESTSMLLIAIGESLKGIDKLTNGNLLSKYPTVNWKAAKGMRDVIAHNYFQLDAAIIFSTVKEDIPVMLESINQMINDLRDS